MLLRIQQVSPAIAPLVTPDLARQHTRIDSDADDNLLAIYIDVATAMAQKYLNRSLITQTIQQTFAETMPPVSWPMVSAPALVLPLALEFNLGQLNQRHIDIFYGTVQAVSSVVHTSWSGTATIFAQGTDFDLDIVQEPARIRLRNGCEWFHGANTSITYTAGYGDTPAAVPSPIVNAVLLTTARLYEERGDAESEDVLTRAARSLLDPYRQMTLGL